MSTHTSSQGITNYFGFVMPAVAWTSIIMMTLIHPLDLNEPLSQYGYYESTHLFFGVSLSLGALVWYLFSRHLDQYWRYTSLCTLLASACYAVVAWVPYQPYVNTFIFDLHNIMIVLAATLYSAPMLFIAYSKKHAAIARLSGYLFVIAIILVVTSLVARVAGHGILYAQLLTLLPTSAWLIMVNYLHLQHQRKSHTL
ncbi:hypothetical protein KC973_01390 [Candidatus Saccharibacteria bacterium]|nr:hypothetical protein [Candidatus Saccharibacteria bacterium]